MSLQQAIMMLFLSKLKPYILHECYIVVSFWRNKQSRPRFLAVANFIFCLPYEILCDITFIPSIVNRMQRWWVSWIRFSNYWMRLRMERGIMQIVQGVRPRWITASEISIILHIIRKRLWIVVLFCIQNISKFLKPALPPHRVSSKYSAVSRYSFT